MSRFFFQAFELVQREWRQKHVVILALALVALRSLGRDEPGAFLQIHMPPSDLSSSPIRQRVLRQIQTAHCTRGLTGRMPEYFWPAGRAP